VARPQLAQVGGVLDSCIQLGVGEVFGFARLVALGVRTLVQLALSFRYELCQRDTDGEHGVEIQQPHGAPERSVKLLVIHLPGRSSVL
jgi:hypothetical protein